MNKFHFYYEIAKEILMEADPAPPADAPPADPPSEEPPPADAPPPETGAPAEGGEKKDLKNIKDKVEDKKIIDKDKISDTALTDLEAEIDKLSIAIIEKKEKIKTVSEALAFLDKIDDTKPKKYDNEEKFKKINGFLKSKEYENLSPSNLFAMHNSLKENFKTIQSVYKDKKENSKLKELTNISKKAQRASFTNNLKNLDEKIQSIKNNLNNINQIFDLKDFPKMHVNVQKEVKLAQKNAADFLKKIS